MAHHRVLTFGLALVCVSGCGSESTPSSDASRAGSPAEVSSPVAEQVTPRAARPQPPEPIATRAGNISGEKVKLDLTLFHRRGKTVSLELRLSTSAEAGTALLVNNTFDDGVDQKVDTSTSEDDTEDRNLDGIFLVDGVHGTRYAPARDSRGYCVCDHTDHSVLTRGAPIGLSATFGAPPPEVKTVDVVVPTFGTFSDVPLD